MPKPKPKLTIFQKAKREAAKFQAAESLLDEDDREYDPKPKRKRVRRKIPLPVEVWRRVISHINHGEFKTISALLDTNSLLRDIVLDPTSNVWARTFTDSTEKRDECVTLPKILKRACNAYLNVKKKDIWRDLSPSEAVSVHCTYSRIVRSPEPKPERYRRSWFRRRWY